MNEFNKTFPFVKNKSRKRALFPGGTSPDRLMPSSAINLLLCCLLVILSGCASLFSGVTGGSYQLTPVIKSTPTPSPTPTPAPLTESELAQRIVQGMSLDQKLGQM